MRSARGAPRSSRSTTSRRCSPPSRATCGAASASATGSCARARGAEALERVRELRARGDQVALLVADQRMPGMTGRSTSCEARKLVPDAKRVLLTAYADTEAAIAAINEVALDYYLLKPWDPPEEQLFPVVEDLLTTWESGAALEAGGVRVDRPSLQPRVARPARLPRPQPRPRPLARRRARRRGARAADGRRRRRDAGLPVALLEDGTRARAPDGARARPAARRRRRAGRRPLRPRHRRRRPGRAGGGGLRRVARGCGRCWSSARRPAARPGSRAASRTTSASRPASPAPTSRAARPTRRAASAPSCSRCRTRAACASRARAASSSSRGGSSLSANCVLVASGVSYNQLDAPGFADFTGAGVYYGAALTEARSCARPARRRHRRRQLRRPGRRLLLRLRGQGDDARARATRWPKSMSHYLIEQIAALANIDVRTGTQAVAGGGRRAAARAAHPRRGRHRDGRGRRRLLRVHRRRAAHGLARGRRRARRARLHPRRADAQGAGWPLKRDPYPLETSVPGVFVAGDVRARSIKRVRQRGRRGLDGRVADPPVPGGMTTVADLPSCAVDLFDELDDDRARGVGGGGRGARRLAPGDRLCRAGRAGAGMLLLLEGDVRACSSSDGRPEPIGQPGGADLDRRDRGAHRGADSASASSPTTRLPRRRVDPARARSSR